LPQPHFKQNCRLNSDQVRSALFPFPHSSINDAAHFRMCQAVEPMKRFGVLENPLTNLFAVKFT
jgi:hypothetical protein